jgi:mercuric reductase
VEDTAVKPADAVWKLNQRLPLKERQRKLPGNLVALHRAILRSFAQDGRPLSRGQIRQRCKLEDVDFALGRLEAQDLIVLDGVGEPQGAYPVTMKPTPHRLTVNGHRVYAMCALDALGVSPMFHAKVEIDSSCEVTGDRIHILQDGLEVVVAEPATRIHVGLRWQTGGGAAAVSL